MKEFFSYVLLAALAAFLLWFLVAQITGQKYKKKIFGTRRIPGSSSEIPVGGNVFGVYFTLRDCCTVSVNGRRLNQRLIGAFFLKWILEGKAVVKSAGGLLRSASMNLSLDEGFTDRTEMALFEMALAASGRDYVLTTGEFNRWVHSNFRIVENWTDRARVRGRRYLISRGLLDENTRGTEAGFARLRGVIEFSNYLKKSSLSPRQLPPPEQWTDYLVLAALCGKADKVAEQLRRSRPAEFSQYSARQARISGSLDLAISISISLSKAFVRAADKEDARSS